MKPKSTNYTWKKGDLIATSDAAELLGYKSSRNLQGCRLELKAKEFEAVGCRLTTNIFEGGERRFLRSEIDLYLTRKVQNAQKFNEKTNQTLRLVA